MDRENKPEMIRAVVDGKVEWVDIVHSPDDGGWYAMTRRYSVTDDLASPIYETRRELLQSLNARTVTWTR